MACRASPRFRTPTIWSTAPSRSASPRLFSARRSACLAAHPSARAANTKAAHSGSRKTLFNRLGRYEKGNGPKAISAYVALARKHGLDPAQMAIAFVVSRQFVTSTIIGATTLEQLKTGIAAADLKIADNLLEDINRIHLDYSNPCP